MNNTDPIQKLLSMVQLEGETIGDVADAVKREESEITVNVAATMAIAVAGLAVLGKRYLLPYCKKRFTGNQSTEVTSCNIRAQHVTINTVENGEENTDTERNRAGNDVTDPAAPPMSKIDQVCVPEVALRHQL